MTTLKGIFPDLKPVRRKNFIHENVKNLHRMKKISVNTATEDIQKSQIHNRKRINNNNYNEDSLLKPGTKQHEIIHAKGTANHKSELYKKSSAPILTKTASCTKKPMRSTNNNISVNQKKECHKHRPLKKSHGKVLSDSNLSCTSVRDNLKTEVRNQGIQTLNTTEIDNLYSEGIIKYPSKRFLSCNEANEEIGKPSEGGDTPVQNETGLKNPKEETDFIKLNKQNSSTTSKIANKTNSNNINNPKPNTSASNYRMGVVPKYIKNRKETLEKIEKAKTKELDANCPDGHVPLPDDERRETLRVLRKNYQEFVNELNMLPIKVDTLRAQRRKMEIEKQLNKLEEGIKVFSRPKVYVKMNA